MSKSYDKFKDEWTKLGEVIEESKKAYEKEADDFYNNLSYEEKLLAFYSVVKRIYEGEIIQKGSYRYVLYDIFKFGPESYGIGMDCGYLDLHNSIDIDKENFT